jgi:hypothetical protein
MELARITAVEVVIAAGPGDRGMARSVGLVSGLIGLLAIFVDHGDLLNKGNQKQKSCILHAAQNHLCSSSSESESESV